MQSLENIKKRIRSIQTTRKITNAMKLVAIAKIKKQRKLYDASTDFCYEFYSVTDQLISKMRSFDFVRTTKNIADSNLYIVVTSSLGLCGSYNTNICKKVLEEIQPQDKIIVFGKKGYSFFKSYKTRDMITYHYDFEISPKEFYGLLPLCYSIVSDFKLGKINKVKIAYTKFQSSFKFDPTLLDLLPMSDKTITTDKNNDTLEYEQRTENGEVIIYEPSRTGILKNFLPIYLSTTLYGALVESSLCENANRRNSMDEAVKNAGQLIENLKLEYNQARQERITQEINEIIAGVNAN